MNDLRIVAITMVIVVSICNIVLNITLKSAVVASNSYISALLSWRFLLAFLVGMISVLSLLAVYSTRMPLSKGILLMGATSIIVGTFIGALLEKRMLTAVEWGLLGSIVVFYTAAWLR